MAAKYEKGEPLTQRQVWDGLQARGDKGFRVWAEGPAHPGKTYLMFQHPVPTEVGLYDAFGNCRDSIDEIQPESDIPATTERGLRLYACVRAK